MSDEAMIYETTVRNKFVCTHATSFQEFIEALEMHVAFLKEMQAAGVQLETDNGIGDDYAHFTTQDVEVAKRFGMERQDLQELIEEDKSDAPMKAFDPVTGELIATGNNSEEVEEAVKGRMATIVTFPVVPLHPANKLH
jgi:hypothetical protein